MPLLIQENYTARLAESLKRGDLDVIVVALPFEEPGIVSQAVYDEPFRVLLPPKTNCFFCCWASCPLIIRIIDILYRPRTAQVFLLLAPISLVDRHGHAGELGNIISRKGYIVLIEHLQRAHNIVLRKTVDVLLAHIIVRFK